MPSKIDLEEETGLILEYYLDSDNHNECVHTYATKKEVLTAAIPILRLIENDDRATRDADGFLDYIEQLLQEK